MSGRDYSPGVFGTGGQLLRVADLAGPQLRDKEEPDIALSGAGASSSSSSAASAAGLRAPSRAGVGGRDGNMPAGHGEEEEVDDDEEGEEDEEVEFAPLASDEALARGAAAAAPGAAAQPAIETLFASRDTVLAHVISLANEEGAGIVDGASGREAFDTPPGPPDPRLLKALADKLEENAEAAGKKVAKNVCFVGGAKCDLVSGEPAPRGSVACATSLNAPLHHEGMTTPGTSTRQRFPALGILEGEYEETVRTIRVVELLHEPYGTAAKDGEAHGRAGLVLPPGYLLTEAFPCVTPITELGASVTIPKNVEVTRIMLLIMLANGVRFLNVASARAATCFRSIVSTFLPSAKMTSVDIHPAGYDEGIRADVVTGVNLQAACTSAGVAWPKDLPAPAPFNFVMFSTDHYCVAGRKGNPARMSLALAVTLALGGAQVTPEQIEQSRDALQLDIDENPGAYFTRGSSQWPGPSKVRAYMDTCGCGPCGGKSLVAGNGGGAPIRIVMKTKEPKTGADSLPIGRAIEYRSCSAAKANITSETDAVAVGSLKGLAIAEGLISRASFPTHNLLGLSALDMRRQALRDPSTVRAYMDTCGCSKCGGKSLVAGNGGGAPIRIDMMTEGRTTGADSLPIGRVFGHTTCRSGNLNAFLSSETHAVAFGSLKGLAIAEGLISRASFPDHNLLGLSKRDMRRQAMRDLSAVRAYMDACGCSKCGGKSLVAGNGGGAPVRITGSMDAAGLLVGSAFSYSSHCSCTKKGTVTGIGFDKLKKLALDERLVSPSSFPVTRVGGVAVRRFPSAFRAYVDWCSCGKCGGKSLIQSDGAGAAVRFTRSRGAFTYTGCGRVRGTSLVQGTAAEDLKRFAISEGLAIPSSSSSSSSSSASRGSGTAAAASAAAVGVAQQDQRPPKRKRKQSAEGLAIPSDFSSSSSSSASRGSGTAAAASAAAVGDKRERKQSEAGMKAQHMAAYYRWMDEGGSQAGDGEGGSQAGDGEEDEA
jgi:hypothetical protein